MCALLVNHLQQRADQKGLEIRLGESAKDTLDLAGIATCWPDEADEHITIHHD